MGDLRAALARRSRVDACLPSGLRSTALIASARDPSVVIVEHALDVANISELCAATIDMFVSILAGEAANLAGIGDRWRLRGCLPSERHSTVRKVRLRSADRPDTFEL
jgi:hypothetical protein